MAARMYDVVFRPAMTADGTMSKEAQAEAVGRQVQLRGTRETLSLDRIFNYRLARKIQAELISSGWER